MAKMIFGLDLICYSFILIISLIYIRFRRSRARLYQLMKQFDGPPGIPILGNSLDFGMDMSGMPKKLINLYEKKFKKTFNLWFLHVPIVIVFKPEDIQALSSNTFERDSTQKFIAELIGDGLATCTVEKWRRRRRIVNPVFQKSYLIQNTSGIFYQQSLKLSKKLEMECNNGREFNVMPYVVTTTFETVLEATMGYQNQHDGNLVEKYLELFNKSSLLVSKRIFTCLLYPSFMYTIYKYLTGQNGLICETRSIPEKIIKKRRSGLWPKKTDQEENEIKDLVDMVGEASGNSQYLNDQEITDEILTITVAATRTTALINSFNFLMLAMKPEIQEKVFNELDEIFGNSDRMPTADDLNKMVFLDQCLKETQRWASIVPMILRTPDKEIRLSDGRVIPVGAKIAIVSYMTHHDETIYPDPYKWNPDNFLPEKMKHRHPYSYIPFGFDMRLCLGNKYSIMATKVLQSTILRKYKLQTSLKEENIEFDFHYLIQSANGYPVRLEYRKPIENI